MLTKTLLGAAFAAAFLFTATGCSGGDSPSVSQDGKGGMTVRHNGAEATLGGGTTVTEAELTMPFYPGSTEKPNASMKVNAPTEKSYISVRVTPDGIDKIKAFYEANVKDLKFNSFTSKGSTFATASAKRADGSKVAVTLTRKDSDTETEISAGYGLETKK